MTEELLRWKSPYTPIARHHYERSMAMLEDTDYILAPSSFVANSFLTRGFEPHRVLLNHYPVNLKCFTPSVVPRPKQRPLTVISTGRLSLRKGTPYLLEAFRLIHKRHPSVQFKLTLGAESNALPIIKKYADLPIDWAPALPHPQLAERLRSADVFLLPSLEDGFAVTVTEALACGLPVITTSNTGASDLIVPGKNGEIVPIRDAHALAEATLKWADRMLSGAEAPALAFDAAALGESRFEKQFLGDLEKLELS